MTTVHPYTVPLSAIVANPRVPKASIESGLQATDRLLGVSGVPDIADKLDQISASYHDGTRHEISSNELGPLRSQLSRLESDQRSAASVYLSLYSPLMPGEKMPTGADGVNRTMNVFAQQGRQQPLSAAQQGLLLLSSPRLSTPAVAIGKLDEAVELLRSSIDRTTAIAGDLRAALAGAK
ncbi:MAG: hypothetical protein H7123_10050 [Thermoleophilia bacterium]|nr:hypothetical protein [Thermoleophilia bacterium]